MTTSEQRWSGGWVEPVLPLTWSAEGSPASPSASPAVDSPRPTNGGSGPRRGPSFATYDRAGRCWRTYRVSLAGDLETYSATWPRSGMTRSGTVYRLPPSVPLTAAIGSSWLPTPAASPGGYNQSPSPGAAVRPSLGTMARRAMWPTPTVTGNYNRAGTSAKSGDGLATAVLRSWPTPTAKLGDPKRGMPSPSAAGARLRAGRRNLDDAVVWATPTARVAGRGRGWTGPGRPLSEQAGGPLNPTWVEWLMGFPPGWTDLDPSATPSSPRSPSTSDDL